MNVCRACFFLGSAIDIPFFQGAVAVAKTQGLLLNLGISSLLRAMSASPFIDLTVGEFLWGYKDSLSDIINRMLNFKYKLSVPMFGIFAAVSLWSTPGRFTRDSLANDPTLTEKSNARRGRNHFHRGGRRDVDGSHIPIWGEDRIGLLVDEGVQSVWKYQYSDGVSQTLFSS